MSEMIALLRENFVQDMLKAALMVAAICSFMGVYVVLKRIVFVGAALAEISSLGAALAFFAPVVWLFERLVAAAAFLAVLDHYRPLVTGLLMMLVAVAFFSHQALGKRLPREAMIGAAFAGALALTILVLSKVGDQDQHALDLIRGNILGVQPPELIELAIASAMVALIQALFYKEFVLVSFDAEVARTLGYRSPRWELLWYLSLGIIIAVSIHVAGTVLVFAYLVLPPVTALLLSRRLGIVFLLSILFGLLATVAGVLISVSPADLPTGPTIVGCSVVLLGAAAVLAALRSLLAPRPATGRQSTIDD